MTHEEHILIKERNAKRRKSKAKSKTKEKLKNYSYQKTIDSYKKNWKKKGDGRAHKEKGKTMPTSFCSNSHCAKTWKHLNGDPMKGESMKVGIIFYLT